MSIGIDLDVARQLYVSFSPMFTRLEESGVEYCLVGGLAVMVQAIKVGEGRLRATRDADLLLPEDYSNATFARTYLDVYACDPKWGAVVYKALFGDDGLDAELESGEDAFLNMTFVGASEEIDGIETPDFDVCRRLNQRTLKSIEKERLTVFGDTVWVATVDELLGMKRDTIGLLKASAAETSRPQDYEDVATLRRITSGHVGRAVSKTSGLAERLRGILGGGR